MACKHKWIKVGGPTNVGNTKFRQTYKCKICKKFKTVTI